MPRPKSVAYKVFLLLKEVRVASASDIAKILGISRFNIHSALRTLMKNGYVEKIGDVYILKKDIWQS